jgi:hypothetical protein
VLVRGDVVEPEALQVLERDAEADGARDMGRACLVIPSVAPRTKMISRECAALR